MEDDIYFVEVYTNGCPQCGHARAWTVIGPDGLSIGKIYDNEDDAIHIAEILEDAYDRGRQSVSGNESRTYGWDRTIHQTGHLDVEVDSDGQVVAVWFRCASLPFQQSKANAGRAQEMRRLYQQESLPRLVGVEFDRDIWRK